MDIGRHAGRATFALIRRAIANAFSAVIMVIADLDCPGEGFINASQRPMADLRAALADTEP